MWRWLQIRALATSLIFNILHIIFACFFLSDSIKILPKDVLDVSKLYGVKNNLQWPKIYEAEALSAIKSLPPDYVKKIYKVITVYYIK